MFTPAITMPPREGESNLPMDIAFNSSSSIVESVSNNELAAENANLKRQLEELQLQFSKLKQRTRRNNNSPPRGKPKKSPSPDTNRLRIRWLQLGSSFGTPQDEDALAAPLIHDGLHHRHTITAPSPMKISRVIKKSSSLIDDNKERMRDVEAIDEEFASGYDSFDDNVHVISFCKLVCDRASWLVGLLVLQSMSSFIISYNEALLKRHIVIVQFLTMLVGAGGNAGNQATVRVIRGLATGTISPSNTQAFIRNELLIGLCLSIILGVTGCLRALAFSVPLPETICITTALLMIVIISVAIGATLPLGMKHVGIDPAHSSTTIQVLMDILGVTITVYVSAAVLDSKLGEFLGIQNILLQAVQYEEIAPP